MSEYDRTINKRLMWIVLAGVSGPGILFYVIFLYAPCGLGTSLASSDCFIEMTVIFLSVYGLLGCLIYFNERRTSRKMIAFNLPIMPGKNAEGLVLDLSGEILVLAGKSRGRIFSPVRASWAGVPGAILCELALHRGIVLNGKQVSPVLNYMIENELLGMIVQSMQDISRPQDIMFWLRQLQWSSASITRFILERITRAGEMETQEEVLKQRIVDFSKATDSLDARTATLIALAGVSGLINKIVPEKDRVITRSNARWILDTRFPEISIIIKEVELLIARSMG